MIERDARALRIVAGNVLAIASALEQAEREGEPGVIRLTHVSPDELRRQARTLADIAAIGPRGQLRKRLADSLQMYAGFVAGDEDTIIARLGLDHPYIHAAWALAQHDATTGPARAMFDHDEVTCRYCALAQAFEAFEAAGGVKDGRR